LGVERHVSAAPGGTLPAPLSARAGVLRSLTIAGAAIWLSSAAAGLAAAEPTPPAGTIHTIDLPGGVEGIRRAIGDRRPTPAATLAIELARRFHGGTADSAGDDPVLAQLRRWLRSCAGDAGCGGAGLPSDRVPLPGDPAVWRDVVFERRVPEADLMLAILDRREAALLYSALLSMREEVRAWIVARPALLKQLRADAASLLVAAPYLRIDGDRWQLPGGAEAQPVWMAVAGVTTDAAEPLLLGLLRTDGGLPAYLLEVVATLSADQQRAALALADPDVSDRVAAGVELLDGLRVAARGWQIRDRPFWRPSTDPAFLLGQLRVGPNGRLALPGGRLFWTLIFGDGALAPREGAARAAWDDPTPVTAGWLVARIWIAAPAEQPIRYEQTLFASRWFAGAAAAQAAPIAIILRGYARSPQLLRILDRLGVDDVARLAAVVERADGLSQAAIDWRGHTAVIRWQSTLLFLDHMARLGALERDELHRALDVLAAPDQAKASRGTRVRALLAGLGVGAVAGDPPARPVEDALVDRLTRSRLGAGRRVTWEGQAYRIDIGAAERDRIARVRGRDAQPRLDAAWSVFALSDLAGAPDASEALARLARVTATTRLDRAPAIDERLGLEARTAAATARRLLERGPVVRDWTEIRAALDDLGDALATEGFAELAYAASLGWAEDLPLSALAAFRRHVFTKPSAAGTLDASWLPPEILTARGDAWHVVGSLLGLGDALGPAALRRPSLKPLGAAPSLNTGDRRWLVTTVAAFDRRRFTDEAQRQLVAAVAAGRARLGGVHDAATARTILGEAGAPPLRQTLAGWIAEVNPRELPGVLSITEIVRLGSAGGAVPESLTGWGTVQRPVSGRVTAGSLPPWPWERYAGRSLRLVSCALPDLQLTLALRLADLELPAMLVVDLMPSATFELVNTAASRHADDFDTLADYVRHVDQTAVERHLGLLTTAGPLRPVPAGAR
jgi:hypothetical protein